MKITPFFVKKLSNNIFLFGAALVLLASALLPVTLSREAAALQLGDRYLQMASGKPGQTSVQYTFSFELATLTGTSDVEGIMIQACNTAVGTCSGTAGTDVPDVSGVTFVSQNANWQGATNFSVDGTGANDCTAGTRVICLKRTDTTNQTTSTARVVTLGGIDNPSTANTSFFMRITTFDNNTWHSSGGDLQLDTGTVAGAVVQSLSVNAVVAEVLNFCAGSTAVNDITTSVASDCTGVSGTSLNIGTLETTAVNTSPVNINGGDNNNGVVMLRTNAVNGATVSYDAIQQSGTNHQGTLRISGANCSATDTDITDQCIRAQGGTQGTFSAGTERFGMTVGGVNGGSTTSGAYTCDYAAGPNTCKLEPSSNYLGAGSVGSESYGTTNGFAWVDDGTVTSLASSTTVVEDEALILRFAATPSITTPFGSYTAQADFIAVANF
ncbi:MAG TPA: hypothetical protein VFW52_03145 [Candidatus Saccharimonadales bacterium]|nr:hypothetical protein [Candidatus Saccharimonadales bacterium]